VTAAAGSPPDTCTCSATNSRPLNPADGPTDDLLFAVEVCGAVVPGEAAGASVDTADATKDGAAGAGGPHPLDPDGQPVTLARLTALLEAQRAGAAGRGGGTGPAARAASASSRQPPVDLAAAVAGLRARAGQARP